MSLPFTRHQGQLSIRVHRFNDPVFFDNVGVFFSTLMRVHRLRSGTGRFTMLLFPINYPIADGTLDHFHVVVLTAAEYSR